MKKEYILAQCIDDVRGGRRTVEDCVKQNPDIRDLQSLLETALRIEGGESRLPDESRARISSAIMSATKDSRSRTAAWHFPVLTFRTAGTIAAVLAGVLVAGGGTVYASQRSMPGDALYPVKTGTESVQLALTFGAESKADLRLKLAQKRVDEMATQASSGRNVDELQASIATQLDKAVGSMSSSKDAQVRDFSKRLSESSLHGQLSLDAVAASAKQSNKKSLQDAIDVLRRGKVIGDVSFDNPTFLGTKPSVLDVSLDGGEFKITGTVTNVAGTTWNIDGMTLNNVHYPGDAPPVDGQILAEGITHAGQTYVVKVEKEGDASKGASIQGTFDGTGEGGTVWYVGGVPVAAPQNTAPPATGDELHLRRPPQSSSDSGTEVKSKKNQDVGVQYDGKLSAVDLSGRTVTVTKAGTRVTVNVGSAQIRNDEDHSMTLTQLQASIGRQVEVKGLSRKNGTIYATQLQVEN